MMSNRRYLDLLCLFSLLLTSGRLWGLEPTQEELTKRAQWAAAKFDLHAAAPEKFVDQVVVEANYAPVQKDNRYGRAMKMGDRLYTNGLYCHAPSLLNVALSQSAVKLTAVIGIDHNEDTAAGGGSIQFLVRSGEKVFFQSEIFHGSQAGVPIEVPLPNLKEFSLEVNDGGDGFACDQADWVNIAVELEDGTQIPLSSLPLIQPKEDQTFEAIYPFEFTYGGRSSREFLSGWNKSVTERTEENKHLRTLVFEEPNGGLQVVCDSIEYLDFPTIEWKLTFKNNGSQETSILENILPLSTTFSRENFNPTSVPQFDPTLEQTARANRQGEFLLHHFKGGGYGPNDYTPLETQLGPNATRDYLSAGRPCTYELPYFNLQANRQGWIIVVGWSGQWKASFVRDHSVSTHITAGQATTHLKLLPGEEIRTPLVVVQNWTRSSWLEAQNVWRAWMLKYNVPHPNGDMIRPHIAGCSSHWYAEMTQADEASQLLFLNRYAEEKIDLDYWWMDAGWYPCDGNWMRTGTWKPDTTRFPKGLRPITDEARKRGIHSIVWFEPERVHADTELAMEHSDWILPGEGSLNGLLNLGNNEAREWLTNRVDSLIHSEGIDFYRQDFNMDPLANWQKNDAPDRQGMTENQYVQGYLAYWDALVARNPGLRIDTCASGGNRNDLETLRRAVPLWRDDCFLDPTAYQNQTFGLSLWAPLHGTGWRALDVYGARSAMVPYLNLLYDLRDQTLDYDAIRSYIQTWRDVFAPLFTADYYPLTPLLECENPIETVDYQQNIWLGWQYNDPKTGSGAIQMFRRNFSPYKVGTFALYGLELDAVYTVTDYDTGQTADYSGEELMKKGLDIKINDAPGAVILTYRKK